MKTSIDTQAEILNSLIIEDRQEIRGIRASIYNLVIFLSTASFAISAFLLGKEAPQTAVARATWMCLATDGVIAILLWALFARLMSDLYCCRQCLVARQNLLKARGEKSEQDDWNPFPNARNVTPDIKDSELRWLPAAATAAIALKSLAALLLYG